MRLVITGADGMLGRTLMRMLASYCPIGISSSRCEISCPNQVRRTFREIAPECVIHCAAFTSVDECEVQEDRAWAVNALGSGNIAAACGSLSARLIALSTDYVFSRDLGRPAHEWDPPSPQCAYGRTKLAGEEWIRALCPNHLIIRTAWLYGPGGPSFLHTMLRLGAEGGSPIPVVADQVGNPTSTIALGEAIIRLLGSALRGIVHVSCEGEASWYEFACELFSLTGMQRRVRPCSSSECARRACRPADSRLEKRVLRLAGLPGMPEWRHTLKRFVQEYPNG